MTEQERIESIKKNGGQHLKNFKKENITYSMCLEAVSLDGTALYYVPEEFKDEQMYIAACSQNGEMLFHVPEKWINKQLCEKAVKTYGDALKYVPLEYKTYELCKAQRVYGCWE